MLHRGLIKSGLEPDAPVPPVLGECQCCGCELRADYTYFEDNEANKFCSEDCVISFYKVEEKEWD